MPNNNFNKPQDPNNGKKNSAWATVAWILIPLLVIGAMYFTFNMNSKATNASYYQVVSYFDNDQVTQYSLNLSSGKLSYVLKGEKEARTYSVPNVDLFLIRP